MIYVMKRHEIYQKMIFAMEARDINGIRTRCLNGIRRGCKSSLWLAIALGRTKLVLANLKATNVKLYGKVQRGSHKRPVWSW